MKASIYKKVSAPVRRQPSLWRIQGVSPSQGRTNFQARPGTEWGDLKMSTLCESIFVGPVMISVKMNVSFEN
jgi:hypothetical protein